MTTVATLTIEMAANLARLQKDMAEAKNTVGGAMDGVSKAVDFAKKAFIALGGAASITAFAGAIKGALETSAALTDLSKKTGVSIEALSKFSDVGKLSGTSVDQIAGALAKLSKNFDGTAKVTKESAAALNALGIDYQSFMRMNPEQRMTAVAKAMDNFADGSGKTAAAMALFGKTGADLIPMLSDLADAGDLQARITTEQAEAADEFLDNLEKLKISGGQWKLELANGMAPALKVASQAFLDVINGAGGLRDELGQLNSDGSIERWTRAGIIGLTYLMDIFAGVKRVVQSVGEYFGAVAAQITIFFSSVGAAAKRFFSGDFAGALEEVKGGMRQADSVAADLRNTLSEVWSEETVGQKVRARIAEIEKLGKEAEATKPMVDMRATLDGNAGAARKQVEALEGIVVTAKRMKEEELEAIEIYRKKIKLTDEQTAAIKAQSEEASAWSKAMDSVFTGLTDALFRAFEEGKGFMQAFRDTLENAFKTLILRPTIEGIMRPIAGALGGVMGGIKTAGASAVSGIGSIGSGSGLLSGIAGVGGLAGMGGMFGAGLGFGASWLGSGATLAGVMPGIGGMLSSGTLGGLITGIGGIVGALGPIAVGIGLLVKGFTRGPKKITEEGISGSIVGGDMTAEAYAKWKQSGSWFVSGRKGVKYSDLGEEASLALEQTTAQIYGGMAEYADALGLPVELLSQVNYEFKAAKGKTEEETAKNLEAAFEGYRQALAAKFADVLEPFRNAGETLADTLERLVAVQQASETLNQFGGVFSRIATLSVEAREELIGMAGGIEALIAKAQAFVGAYYSEGEQAGIAARPILEAMQALGITDAGAYSTKAEFRALIESMDVSTTEGRRALTTLLDLAPSFAQVADYIAKAGGTLGDVAGAAPQVAVLEAMFAENQTATAYAEQTAAGVAAVETAVTSSGQDIVAAVNGVTDRISAMEATLAESLARLGRDVTGSIEMNLA